MRNRGPNPKKLISTIHVDAMDHVRSSIAHASEPLHIIMIILLLFTINVLQTQLQIMQVPCSQWNSANAYAWHCIIMLVASLDPIAHSQYYNIMFTLLYSSCMHWSRCVSTYLYTLIQLSECKILIENKLHHLKS